MNRESQLIWEAYEHKPLSGTWSATINGTEYTGSVQDLINNTQHIQEVDYPVAELVKFGMYKFTKDGSLGPRDPEGVSTNMDGKWVKYRDLTPQQKLDHSNDELETMNNADMRYPIFVAVDSDNAPVGVIDGNHRLAKAIRDKHSTIKTKFVTKELL